MQLPDVRDIIDRKNPPGLEQLGTGYGKLPHRAATEDRDGISRLDLRQLGSHVTRGKDIGDQERLFVGNFVRKLHQPHPRKGNACLFRLQAMYRTRFFGTTEKTGSSLDTVGIGIVALGIIACPAVGTIAAGNR